MHTLIAALVLAAGSLQPAVQPTAAPQAPAPAAQVAGASVPPLIEAFNFTDASLIPAWAVKPDGRNAALGYMKAVIELPDPLRDAARDLDWSVVGTSVNAAELPDAFHKAAGLFRQNSPHWMELVREASSRERCDFELNYEGGVGMLLPHLGHLRNLARCLRVQARLFQVDGKHDQAADCLAACFRMAAHVTNDRVLISTLVGVAINNVATDEAGVLAASGKLSPEAARRLRDAIAAVVKTDEFASKAALGTERDMFLEWLRIAVTKGEVAPEGLASLLGRGDDPGIAQSFRGLTGKELDREIGRARNAYDDVLDAWDTPEAITRLQVIAAKIDGGEYGLVAAVTMPSFMRAKQASEKAVAALKSLDEKLAAAQP